MYKSLNFKQKTYGVKKFSTQIGKLDLGVIVLTSTDSCLAIVCWTISHVSV